MAWDLADYEPVENRIRAFYSDDAEGCIRTELVAHGDGHYIVKASVYRRLDVEPGATGYAEESVTERGVNATSALENCETSAIGRALANLGYAAKGKRPSREEMSKTNKPAASAAPVLATESGAQAGDGATHPSVPGAADRPEPEVTGEGTEGSGEREPAGDAAPAVAPPSAPDRNHDHVWIPSPKLAKSEVCSVDGCYKVRRKSAVA